MLGVRGQHGVLDELDRRMRLEELGDLQRVGRHPLHPQPHGLQALEQDPRVERAHPEPGMTHQVLDRPGHELLRAQHRAAEHAALTVDVLGGGVDHHVGAQLEWLLVQHGGKHVVHHDLRTGGVGEFAHRAHVHQLLHRIRWRLEEHGVGRLAQRLAPLVEVGSINKHGLDAPARQDVVADHETRTEQRPRRHQPRALATQGG